MLDFAFCLTSESGKLVPDWIIAKSAILNKIGNRSSYRGRVVIGIIVTILPFVLCCALPAGALIFGYSELREPDESTKVFEQAEAYALAGDTERASTAFAQAVQPAIETDDHIRNLAPEQVLAMVEAMLA